MQWTCGLFHCINQQKKGALGQECFEQEEAEGRQAAKRKCAGLCFSCRQAQQQRRESGNEGSFINWLFFPTICHSFSPTTLVYISDVNVNFNLQGVLLHSLAAPRSSCIHSNRHTQSQLGQKENSNTTLTQAHVIPMHAGPKPITGNSGARRWEDMSLKVSG